MDGRFSAEGGKVGAHRRHRVRLEVSREASRLFWEQGVDATTGDQIAAAVGLSTRTIWRLFRNKESCAEPVVTRGVAWEMSVLRRWPPHLSLEEHFAAEVLRYGRGATDLDRLDDLLAMRMAVLAGTEPAIRTAWLMARDQACREMAEVIALRTRRPADDLQVLLYAAAVAAAVRVLNESIGAALLAGADPRDFADAPRLVARAVRSATGGAVGGPTTAA
ncbi:TetR/AcrR family transcriptional regulator [Streptomyces sp. WAC 04229]|uniref:TetR/AcrR family transcriptional regulator n=1 Tax=Streptomyces sp. WAC 04229 TaxID=2203206 RepID=UPI003D71CA08